jgi:hypothetical protein
LQMTADWAQYALFLRKRSVAKRRQVVYAKTSLLHTVSDCPP